MKKLIPFLLILSVCALCGAKAHYHDKYRRPRDNDCEDCTTHYTLEIDGEEYYGCVKDENGNVEQDGVKYYCRYYKT